MVPLIANAANTIIPAYLVLQSKGYQVHWERNDTTPENEVWYAEGPLGNFIADDSVSLLGLIAMREVRGPDWQASDEQIDAFMEGYQ
jgi:hypothetical protein